MLAKYFFSAKKLRAIISAEGFMTEKEKMLSGKVYDYTDAELVELRGNAHKLCFDYNQTYETEVEKRLDISNKLLPEHGSNLYLQGPVQFDYGKFTSFGNNCYANFNLVILDCAPVSVGDDVFFGPNCSIVTPVHPLLNEERRTRQMPDGAFRATEYAKPISIKSGCWLASNVTVCGGVTIGENCVIGAGSVVTRDIPPNSLAAGVPCRVIRTLSEKDSLREIFPNK